MSRALFVAILMIATIPGRARAFVLPDPVLTPGATRSSTQSELCRPGSAHDARHVTAAAKRAVCQRYGVKTCLLGPGGYEIDHLISLELGGANVVANLWPQPWAEARTKDILENFLHRAVCGGALTLEHAQRDIRTDWPAAYQRMRTP